MKWIALLITGIALIVAAPATATTEKEFKNCTALNKRYAHGVGRFGARDESKSGDPVTNFRRSNRLYRQNKHLDRDKDGVACEKK